MEEVKEEPKKRRKISKESAKAVFEEVLAYYDIDFEDIVNDQGKEGAQTLQNKLIRAISDGRIEVNHSQDPEKGFQIIQNLSTGQTVAYNEYNAKAAEEGDKGKGPSAMQYRLLGSLSGKGVDHIKSPKVFRGPDLKLAEFVAVLFLL